MPHPVLSTYRLQLSGPGFAFADAENIVDYLAELGISHLYLSPILTAEPGSTHGYDVTDPRPCPPNSAAPTGWPAWPMQPTNGAWV